MQFLAGSRGGQDARCSARSLCERLNSVATATLLVTSVMTATISHPELCVLVRYPGWENDEKGALFPIEKFTRVARSSRYDFRFLSAVQLC